MIGRCAILAAAATIGAVNTDNPWRAILGWTAGILVASTVLLMVHRHESRPW